MTNYYSFRAKYKALGQGWHSSVVRALSSHQCGSGSNPGVEAICGLCLLFVLSLAPRGLISPAPGTPVFLSPNSNLIWNAPTRLNEFIWTPKCFVGKQMTIFFTLKESTCYTWFHRREMRPRRLLCMHMNSPTSYPASSLFVNAKRYRPSKMLFYSRRLYELCSLWAVLLQVSYSSHFGCIETVRGLSLRKKIRRHGLSHIKQQLSSGLSAKSAYLDEYVLLVHGSAGLWSLEVLFFFTKSHPRIKSRRCFH